MKTLTAVSVLCCLLLPLLPMGAQTVSPPLFRIVQNGRYGFIDNTGKVVVPPQFLWAAEFRGDFADVYVCGRMVSVDKTGNLVPHVEPKLRSRKIGDKFGFVDASGKLKIPAQYDDARWFSEGLAAVRLGNKWGYIDEAGETAIPFQYALALEFEHGRADVIFGEIRRVEWSGGEIVEENKDGSAIIDTTGRIIVKGLELRRSHNSPQSHKCECPSSGDGLRALSDVPYLYGLKLSQLLARGERKYEPRSKTR